MEHVPSPRLVVAETYPLTGSVTWRRLAVRGIYHACRPALVLPAFCRRVAGLYTWVGLFYERVQLYSAQVSGQAYHRDGVQRGIGAGPYAHTQP